MRDPYVISSFCSGGECVGVIFSPEGVTVVDSNASDGVALHFTQGQWLEFVAGVKAGEFDLPSQRAPDEQDR